jgi:hypothetical protein
MGEMRIIKTIIAQFCRKNTFSLKTSIFWKTLPFDKKEDFLHTMKLFKFREL